VLKLQALLGLERGDDPFDQIRTGAFGQRQRGDQARPHVAGVDHRGQVAPGRPIAIAA